MAPKSGARAVVERLRGKTFDRARWTATAARPSLDVVLPLRRDQMSTVRKVLDGLDRRVAGWRHGAG